MESRLGTAGLDGGTMDGEDLVTLENQPTGPLLSRREVVTLLGATGAAWLMTGSLIPRRAVAGTQNPSCVVRPEQPKARSSSTND